MRFSYRLFGGTSGLYIGKSTLVKLLLLAGVVAISAVFIWYNLNVIESLQSDTRDQVDKYVKLWQLAANSDTSGPELQFIFNEIIVKATFPIVVLDQDRSPILWRNVPGIQEHDTAQATVERVKKVAAEMEKEYGEFPLHFAGTHVNYLLYGDTDVVRQLKLMPFVQIGIVVGFLLLGLIGFESIRRSEERHIWVGMAKEAAHQLGTPISALMGWIEVLETEVEEGASPEGIAATIKDTAGNMKVDIRRLERVANRFGQIGSTPDLKPSGLNDLISEVAEYYRRRLPFGGEGIRINFKPGELPEIPLNSELLTWGFENLLKNAMQAVDSKTGRIDITSYPALDKTHVVIEMQDNGKGITAAAARKIFRPGFTTKKRGWGLGLTLVKRIIEDYHGGKVWLERSKPGETLFMIKLPVHGRVKEG
jgi:signal transduction histidine kinase